MLTSIRFKRTSAIYVADIRKAPDVAKSHHAADDRKEELEPIAPVASLCLLLRHGEYT